MMQSEVPVKPKKKVTASNFKETVILYDYDDHSYKPKDHSLAHITSVEAIIEDLFNTSDLSDPNEISIKHKGVKELSHPRFVQGTGVIKDPKNKNTGFWVEDHEKSTLWMTGVWKTKDDTIYAKVKVSFFKQHAEFIFEYLDPFVFADVFVENAEIMSKSKVFFFSINENKVVLNKDLQDPKGILNRLDIGERSVTARTKEALLSTIRFYGQSSNFYYKEGTDILVTKTAWGGVLNLQTNVNN